MKAYTDIEQSKKLAEILPIEGADMCWTSFDEKWDAYLGTPNPDAIKKEIPCWSFAALLDYLREIEFFPSIEADEHGVTMNVCYYDDEEGKLLNPVHDITTEADNFVDACYEIIIKLHEQRVL